MPSAHSEEFINRVRSLAGEGLDDRAIGEEVNLSRAAVYKIRKNHGIPAGKPHAHSPERIEAIRSMAATGASDRQIGEALGLAKPSVFQLRQRHGIETGWNPGHHQPDVEPRQKPEHHQHGTPSTYNRGCRCDECKAAERIRARESRARMLERFKAGEVEIQHGRSGYTNWGCRCEVCREAGAEANKEAYERRWKADPEGMTDRERARRAAYRVQFRERQKARRAANWDHIREDNDRRLASYQAETLDQADRYGQEWTSRELEILSRRDLTVKQVALMLGRSYHAVRTRRTRLFREERGEGPAEVHSHGLTGYNQGCRCNACTEAKHAYAREYQKRHPRETQADTAVNRKKEWTGAELEMAARDDLSVREIARRLGRSYAAVTAVRHKIKHDPKTINHVGLPEQQNRDA